MSNGTVESRHLVCPQCLGVNRVPATRLHDQPACGKCHHLLNSHAPLALSPALFDRLQTHSELPLVVDFWAPWCGPCLAMAPAFEEAAGHLTPDFVAGKVDTQALPDLGERYSVRSIPTLILFSGGQEVARATGARSAREIEQWVRTHSNP